MIRLHRYGWRAQAEKQTPPVGRCWQPDQRKHTHICFDLLKIAGGSSINRVVGSAPYLASKPTPTTETIMKIPLRKPPGARNVVIEAGRHVGTVVQVAHVGLQPAYERDGPTYATLGVAVEFDEGVIARTIRISQHPSSLFFGLQVACSLGDADELDLGDLLGKAVACEIEHRDTWPTIRSFGPTETFDVVPAARSPLIQFDVDALERGEGRDEFLKLHPDIRRAISRRVRVRP